MEDGQNAGRWTYVCDGGVLGRNPSPRGVYFSVWCKDPRGVAQRVVVRHRHTEYHTNQDAEWLAMRAALSDALQRRALHVDVRTDSMFVVKQFNGQWRAKIERHAKLMHECRGLAREIGDVTVGWTPREVVVSKLGH